MGAGPLLYYPATNEALGTTRWGSGPSVAFAHEDKGPWLFGLVANNIWSIGGVGLVPSRVTSVLGLPYPRLVVHGAAGEGPVKWSDKGAAIASSFALYPIRHANLKTTTHPLITVAIAQVFVFTFAHLQGGCSTSQT